MQEMEDTCVRSLGREHLLEKEKATHSGILAWETPRTEKSGRLYSPRGRKVSDASEHAHNDEKTMTSSLALSLSLPSCLPFSLSLSKN